MVQKYCQFNQKGPHHIMGDKGKRDKGK